MKLISCGWETHLIWVRQPRGRMEPCWMNGWILRGPYQRNNTTLACEVHFENGKGFPVSWCLGICASCLWKVVGFVIIGTTLSGNLSVHLNQGTLLGLRYLTLLGYSEPTTFLIGMPWPAHCHSTAFNDSYIKYNNFGIEMVLLLNFAFQLSLLVILGLVISCGPWCLCVVEDCWVCDSWHSAWLSSGLVLFCIL